MPNQSAHFAFRKGQRQRRKQRATGNGETHLIRAEGSVIGMSYSVLSRTLLGVVWHNMFRHTVGRSLRQRLRNKNGKGHEVSCPLSCHQVKLSEAECRGGDHLTFRTPITRIITVATGDIFAIKQVVDVDQY